MCSSHISKAGDIPFGFACPQNKPIQSVRRQSDSRGLDIANATVRKYVEIQLQSLSPPGHAGVSNQIISGWNAANLTVFCPEELHN